MIINNNKNISWPGWETIQLIGCGSFGAVYEIQREVFGNIERKVGGYVIAQILSMFTVAIFTAIGLMVI